MVESYIDYREDEIDSKMQILAWQTSIIINCMGTLKKKVKPGDLYKSDDKSDLPNDVKFIGKDKKAELENELLSIFKINN
ncbi:hypothetical protein GCM10008904_10150 [Paraclostridium ghonii]|uniref:Uncharacterized protein n=1 Tax=Paraclostridium ghonii TaxID=29358 RepID=A0ABU0MYM1_9FIRM|nr:hypothetical protein [Paeniclostridium ghonii]MDQ0555956.1 hypothetical protein [Paeniclostridium ghonii]